MYNRNWLYAAAATLIAICCIVAIILLHRISQTQQWQDKDWTSIEQIERENFTI